MTEISAPRRVVPVPRDFFNDGHFYLLTSTSGGRILHERSPATGLITASDDEIRSLLAERLGLPLYLPIDCALDDTIVVVGELSAPERDEWIGRVRTTIDIRCGEFLLLGWGEQDDLPAAIEHPSPPDPNWCNFHKIPVASGRYVLEVLAFVTSATVDELWEEDAVRPFPEIEDEAIDAWWDRTRPGQPRPEWLETYLEDGFAESEDCVSYLVHLAPWDESMEEIEPTAPGFDDEWIHWVGRFEVRKPALCPLGLRRDVVLG